MQIHGIGHCLLSHRCTGDGRRGIWAVDHPPLRGHALQTGRWHLALRRGPPPKQLKCLNRLMKSSAHILTRAWLSRGLNVLLWIAAIATMFAPPISAG